MGAIASYQMRRADRRMAKTLEFVKGAYTGNLARLLEMLQVDKLSVDAQDRFGMTALHWAAYGGKLLCVQALLNAGASPAVVDNNGRNAIHHACRKDHDDVLRFLLDEAKMDVNSPSEIKDTPLHKAVIGKAIRCIEVLLQRGANPMLRNDQNRTPLDELDADPGAVKDVVPEPLVTARVNEELDQWRQDYLTEVKKRSAQQSSALEALLSPSGKRWGRRSSAETPKNEPTAATDSGRAKYRTGETSTTSVSEVENTLVMSFRNRISERSSRTSSANDLSSSSRTSSAQLPTTGLWARRSIYSSSSPSVPSPASSGRRGSASGVIVPLNLQNITAPPARSSSSSHGIESLDRSSMRSTVHEPKPVHNANPRRRSLRYAGKRVIMALRVKKCLTGDEKRHMIRLILLRHMNLHTQDIHSGRLQGSGDAVTELTRLPSAFTLSLPTNI